MMRIQKVISVRRWFRNTDEDTEIQKMPWNNREAFSKAQKDNPIIQIIIEGKMGWIGGAWVCLRDGDAKVDLCDFCVRDETEKILLWLFCVQDELDKSKCWLFVWVMTRFKMLMILCTLWLRRVYSATYKYIYIYVHTAVYI